MDEKRSKHKPLPSRGRLLELFKYDKQSGVLVWKRHMGGMAKAGSIAGNIGDEGYVRVKVDGELYLAHRLIWLMEKGVEPKNTIDHINGIRSDNRIENLRDVTHAENLQNLRKPRKDNQTGFQGVQIDKRDGAYMAYIRTNGQSKYLGRFKTAEDAHNAYLNAKRSLHKTCTI